MKSKNIIVVGIFSLIIFMGIATYLWYLYFHEYEGKLLAQNTEYDFTRGVELVNSGSTTYLNATNEDDDAIIPTYYFRVKNNMDKDFNYVIYFENAEANDGCTKDTTFSRDELEYELKLDNKVIKTGGLETINNNVLDVNTIAKNSIKDYALKVRLKSSVTDYDNKHFHYVINMKEKK